jgi:hypothetical protein
LRYAKEFLDLQLEFAETVSALSGLPLARTVLDYTNFYARFGLGREFYDFYGIWQGCHPTPPVAVDRHKGNNVPSGGRQR